MLSFIIVVVDMVETLTKADSKTKDKTLAAY